MKTFPQLNFPVVPEFRWKSVEGKTMFWDSKRKKYLVMTPEEWVRQHVIAWLEAENYPPALIALERKLEVNKLTKRFDIVVFNRHNKPYLLVECKRPGVKISEETFHQILIYNRALQAPYLLVTNGLTHYVGKVENNELTFLKNLPPFENE